MRLKLINAREAKGMSALEVSEYLNITERMYHYIEAGDRNGNYEIWDKLEDFFGVHQRHLREITTYQNNTTK